MTRKFIIPVLLFLTLMLSACGGGAQNGDAHEITVYSGRTQELIQPLVEEFEQESGITVNVRYGDSAELAATILEEGNNTPADVYYSQDAGALGALADAGSLLPLPEEILDKVEPRFRSPDGLWVGVSGRARVVAYNTLNVSPDELPDTIYGFTDPKWAGRIGWAPTNGSFQAFVTAMRVLDGEDAAREWLTGILANDPVVYSNNAVALAGVSAGEVDVAFINHYYLYRALAEAGQLPGVSVPPPETLEADPEAPETPETPETAESPETPEPAESQEAPFGLTEVNAENYFLPGGDPGALINVTGVGLLDASNPDALAFINFLLEHEAQEYFATQTFEYPLVMGVEAVSYLPPLSSIESPHIDLSDLSDLQGTLLLLQEVGALE